MSREIEMSVSLSVLENLGINLYSNIPAVISEAIANSYDADAKKVDINIDLKYLEITIQDDGIGMTKDDIIKKYLCVGYRRRDEGHAKSPSGRSVMGRKGIGKLALFSIAKIIEVHTKTEAGKVISFEMDEDKIKGAIRARETSYKPKEIESDWSSKGTKIVLKKLKKKINNNSGNYFRKRIARRFSILETSQMFKVFIDDSIVSIQDRDYYSKIEYVWPMGEYEFPPEGREQFSQPVPESGHIQDKLKEKSKVVWTDENDVQHSECLSGWLATARKHKMMRESDETSVNKIIIMVRGKLAHEDILPYCQASKVATKYIFGELNADFLDEDEKIDIATSDRQSISEEDPRFEGIVKCVKDMVKIINNEWDTLRSKSGMKEALKSSPIIKDWFNDLNSDAQTTAHKMFGAVNKMAITDEEKNTQFERCVLGVEVLDKMKCLSALDEDFHPEDINFFGRMFEKLDILEASLCHGLTKARLSVINQLGKMIDSNEIEKVIQKYLFNHLWLLDPSWDHATSPIPRMEQSVTKEFDKVEAQLTEEDRRGRIDIRYQTAAEKHIIVELKRKSVSLSAWEIVNQMDKYKKALKKCLIASGVSSPHIECVCLIGKDLKDWSEEGGREDAEKKLNSINARVIKYEELIYQAQEKYKEYFEKIRDKNKIKKIVKAVSEALHNEI